MGPQQQDTRKKIEMIQRRVARFRHNDYKTIVNGCNDREIKSRTTKYQTHRHYSLTLFNKAINGNLALPIGHIQPVLRRTRHLNSKTYNTIHTSKYCYTYSFFPRTIYYWNSLPDKLGTIKEPHKFKLVLTHFD